MSIIDDYEQDTFVSYSSNPNTKEIFDKDANLDPIFKKHKVELGLEDNIVKFAVCNNVMVMYLANQKLICFELIGSQRSEIDLSKVFSSKCNLIKNVNLFLSPTGRHCLLSISFEDNSPPECYYVSKKKSFPLKIKGHFITAVGWNLQFELSESNQSNTYTCFLGTSRGLLLELELSFMEDNKWTLVNSSIDHHLRQIYDLKNDVVSVPIVESPDCETLQITGIEFHYEQLASSSNSYMYFIIVTTNTQIFQFVDTIDRLENISKITSLNRCDFQEFPGNSDVSCLRVLLNHKCRPYALAWLIDPGIYYAQLDLNLAIREKKIVNNHRLIPYRESIFPEMPVSIALSKYHILVLFPSFLKIISIINGQTVMEDKFLEPYGEAMGIVKDPLKKTIWAYTKRSIYRYKIKEEDRNNINIYMQQNDYINARICAKGDVSKINLINCQEAEYLFSNKRYLESARMFAKSNKSFEDIALKFLSLNDNSYLKEFLINKLDTLSSKDKTQTCLLIIWIIELIMKDVTDALCLEHPDEDKIQILKFEFESIISNDKLKSSLQDSKEAIYELLTNHFKTDFMCTFALHMEDFDVAIDQHLQLGQIKEAFDLLYQHQDQKSLYIFAPILFREKPIEMIDLLIQHFPYLDYSRLLPTLICCRQPEEDTDDSVDLSLDLYYDQLIRYLEHCVVKLCVKEPIVLNYLLTIYAEFSPEKLIELCKSDANPHISQFDLKCALHICSERKLNRACVEIYSLMQLYDEAVETALLLDVDLAKQIADRPEIEEEQRKRLWKRIAEYLIQSECDNFKLDGLLHECPLLRINDLMQYLPEVTTIDYFNHAIRESLREFQVEFQSLHDDMIEVKECNNSIKQQQRSLRSDHCALKTQHLCSVCGYSLQSDKLVAFPCRHIFHLDCIEQHLLNEAPVKLRNKINAIKAELNGLLRSGAADDAFESKLVNKKRIIQRFNDLLASECPFCDEIMISSIDKPFVVSVDDKIGWQ